MHYIFLDDPRTEYVTGEPKYSNLAPLTYDHATGRTGIIQEDVMHQSRPPRNGAVRASETLITD
jgi:hypothetical protein